MKTRFGRPVHKIPLKPFFHKRKLSTDSTRYATGASVEARSKLKRSIRRTFFVVNC